VGYGRVRHCMARLGKDYLAIIEINKVRLGGVRHSAVKFVFVE
jgi:hypothetical protein